MRHSPKSLPSKIQYNNLSYSSGVHNYTVLINITCCKCLCMCYGLLEFVCECCGVQPLFLLIFCPVFLPAAPTHIPVRTIDSLGMRLVSCILVLQSLPIPNWLVSGGPTFKNTVPLSNLKYSVVIKDVSALLLFFNA